MCSHLELNPVLQSCTYIHVHCLVYMLMQAIVDEGYVPVLADQLQNYEGTCTCTCVYTCICVCTQLFLCVCAVLLAANSQLSVHYPSIRTPLKEGHLSKQDTFSLPKYHVCVLFNP